MPARPPGSLVSLTWDGYDDVMPGDYLRTVTTGRTYRIEHVRVQVRGMWAGRKHLRAIVMEPDFETAPGDVVHLIQWYPRRRRR